MSMRCTQGTTDPFTDYTNQVNVHQPRFQIPEKATPTLKAEKPEAVEQPEFFSSQRTKNLINFIFKDQNTPVQGYGTSLTIDVLDGTKDYIDLETGNLKVSGTYVPMSERISQRVTGDHVYESNYEVLSIQEIYGYLDSMGVSYSKSMHKDYLLNLLKKYEQNDLPSSYN